MAPGPRMIFDKSLLNSTVRLGQQDVNIMDMINIFPRTGTMVVESVPEFGDPDAVGSNRKPFEFAPTGITEDINILLSDVAFSIDQIRQVTGTNEVADGTSQQKDMLQGVMKGLQEASNNAHRPQLDIYQEFTVSNYDMIAQKWRISLYAGDIEVDDVPLSDGLIRSITISKDLYNYDYGLYMTVKPTEEDKQIMIADIVGKRNNQQIPAAESFTLIRMIRNGDLKMAEYYYAKAEERFKKQVAAEQQQIVEAQAQANAQSAQSAEQSKQQSLRLEYQLKNEHERVKEEEKRKTLAMQVGFNAETYRAKSASDVERSFVEKTADAALNPSENAPPQSV